MNNYKSKCPKIVAQRKDIFAKNVPAFKLFVSDFENFYLQDSFHYMLLHVTLTFFFFFFLNILPILLNIKLHPEKEELETMLKGGKYFLMQS